MEKNSQIAGNYELKRTILHEISHFVTRRVVKYDAEKRGSHNGVSEISQFGFDREMQNGLTRGITEEPLAELFTAYCVEEDGENASVDTQLLTPYPIQSAFMLSFLEEYATRAHITPKEAFAKMFRAKVMRDFSFQAELQRVFSTETVRSLNNLEKAGGAIYGTAFEPMGVIAEREGFSDVYAQRLTSFKTKIPVGYSGMQTTFISEAVYDSDEIHKIDKALSQCQKK